MSTRKRSDQRTVSAASVIEQIREAGGECRLNGAGELYVRIDPTAKGYAGLLLMVRECAEEIKGIIKNGKP